jgi:pimeloyl-ACP methyl ester carboxylesterase
LRGSSRAEPRSAGSSASTSPATIRAPASAKLKSSQVPAQIIWGEADVVFDTRPSLDWLRTHLGGLRKVIAVPRAKLFFTDEHPRLVSVLLQEFWRSFEQR